MLFLLALERCNAENKTILETLFKTTPADPSQKIEQVKALFVQTGAVDQIKQMINHYIQKALDQVDQFPIKNKKKEIFKTFSKELMERKLYQNIRFQSALIKVHGESEHYFSLYKVVFHPNLR
jgi:Geranylgeranyl pyrophosphate synthase